MPPADPVQQARANAYALTRQYMAAVARLKAEKGDTAAIHAYMKAEEEAEEGWAAYRQTVEDANVVEVE